MKKIAFFAGALVLTASLHASTSYILDFNTTQGTVGAFDGGTWAISPYTGNTVAGTTVSLYCDDFNDNINYGQTGISVYSTALTASSALLSADTRYGASNSQSTNYSTQGGVALAGTTLYDEMAWLATQMQNTGSGGNAANNNLALQEAIWDLTNDQTNPNQPAADRVAPNNSSGFSATTCETAGCDAGTPQSAVTWIADAQSYVAGFMSGHAWTYASDYTALNTNDWFIITSVGSAGCILGSETNGCSGVGGSGAGTAGTGTVTQEFLAYSSGGLVTTTGGNGATPEPASFILIGSGLMAAALFGRRRRNRDSNL